MRDDRHGGSGVPAAFSTRLKRRGRRFHGAFTIIEVLVALAIFLLASIMLASAYVNILNGYAIAGRSQERDDDIAFARQELLLAKDLTTAQAGDEFDTPQTPTDLPRHVKWTADVEPTAIPDLFTVTLSLVITKPGGGQDAQNETFTLLRPTWSDPTDRTSLRQQETTRIMQLQGRQQS
jgi:general secretion pathway protein I